jgi:hypothetical protein
MEGQWLVGGVGVFRTPYEQYRVREGQRFEVVRVIDAADAEHDAECLPMYVVRFGDGAEVEAWPEELSRE